MRSELLEIVPKSASTFLEVGCGNGIFGAELKKIRNAEVWGIEPSLTAANEARKRIDEVINDTFHPGIPVPKNYFDCIVFNDVLEHMTDPWDTLRYSKDYLKKDTDVYIIGSIPNFRFWGNMKEILIQKDFEYKPSGILDKTHYRFFTLESLERFFKECGYSIELFKGINEEVSWKFKVLNFVTFNFINDMRFLQFAFVVKPEII